MFCRFAQARLAPLGRRSLANLALLKELRAVSGAPVGDCKKALKECDGLDDALDWLRKKAMRHNTSGALTAAKKADRASSEGLVGLRTGRDFGLLLHLCSETDFVARNERFQTLVNEALDAAEAQRAALGGNATGETRLVPLDVEKLLAQAVPGVDEALGDRVAAAVTAIRENIKCVETGNPRAELKPSDRLCFAPSPSPLPITASGGSWCCSRRRFWEAMCIGALWKGYAAVRAFREAAPAA
eukprot:scaffold1350_cov249-Pinguiococcus_pyrenoidosus.AAC.21